MNAYQLCVATGIVGALIAARRGGGDLDQVERVRRSAIGIAAVVGAALGAHVCAGIASARGWTDGVAHTQWWGDRTVLGGVLGGWFAVELVKRVVGERAATGDRFALPLAIALTFGRLGCWSAGCCGGRPLRADEPWHALGVTGADGAARVPVQLIEVGFHLAAIIAVLLLERRGALRGRRLAAYLCSYALLRFTLESARCHPPIALGLTWFQWLALALAALAGTTWWRRSRAALASPATVGHTAQHEPAS